MDGDETRAVIVTGGGTGMGRAIAQAFARQGDQVVILGRREEVLRETADALGPSVSWQRADVSRREDVEAAVGAVVARHSQIHVLINAAGFVKGVRADTPLAEAERRWDDTVGTNLKGAFLMSIAVAPYLARPGGRIINISSIAAYTGGSRGGSIEYAAAKAGIHGLTMGLARDLSGQGITVNAIVPGFTAETEFTGGWSEERVRQIVAQTPAGRPGKADDIAAAVLFLAAPEASFITGEVLNVNGGWLFGR
jgi:3-oxoacyl-[acyl-carrier protein] reductase